MEDRQLELAEVKAQFVEAEARLNTVVRELGGAATARESLVAVSETVGSAATQVGEAAGDIAGFTEQLAAAAHAIEQAEPGAVRARLDDVDKRLGRIEEAMVATAKTHVQIRLLIVMAVVAAVAAAVLAVVMA